MAKPKKAAPERFGESPLTYCRYCGAPPSMQCKGRTQACDIETAQEAADRVERVREAKAAGVKKSDAVQ